MSEHAIDKRTSTALVGTSAVLVVVSLLFMALGVQSGAAIFGAILLGLGVVIGIAGAILNLLRR